MKIRNRFVTSLAFALCGALLVTSAFAQDKDAAADANHQLLADMDGSWDCNVAFWMAPGGPPSVSTGTSVRKPLMDGRYFEMDTVAKMQMPGPDGQMHLVDYKGMEIDGFDNVKGKFFSTWIDSMGTGLLVAEGSYDPASKTFTYHLEEDMAPGKTMKVRQTLKIIDHDHQVIEWYEEGAKEEKMMEIKYTRQK